jgi:cyclophilin family peptidyl-prolyl cis-trans isomerase
VTRPILDASDAIMKLGSAVITVLLFSAVAKAQLGWQPLSPEDVLVIDTSKGRVLVEMRSDMAPESVARVKLLTREGVYDGLQFHRVIAHFVAQTGNPNNRDGGVSSHPDLPAEFIFRFKPSTAEVMATDASDSVSGFLGSVPFQGVPLADVNRRADGLLRAWGAYCPGVVGMGRQDAPGSANSEIFFTLDASRRLDRDYAVWGRVLDGFQALQSLAIGEPPLQPDVMIKVRVLADLPPSERPSVSLPDRSALAELIARIRNAKGADFSVCDVEVPVRVETPALPEGRRE